MSIKLKLLLNIQQTGAFTYRSIFFTVVRLYLCLRHSIQQTAQDGGKEEIRLEHIQALKER